MGRGLFLNAPLIGHINPTLGIARSLVESGENILYGLAPKFADLVRATGAEFFPLPSDVYDYFENYNLDEDQKMLNVEWDTKMVCWTERILECVAERFEPGDIDYVITGHRYGAGYEVAQLFGVPHICISPNLVPTESRGKFASEEIFQKEFQENRIACHHAARERARVSSRFKVALRPFQDLYFRKGDLTIVLTTQQLQPQSDQLDSSFVFTGPAMNRAERDLDFFLPSDGKKVVYVSLGSMIQSPSFFRTCIEGLSGIDAWIVMAIGSKVTREELGDTPENFILRNEVPQMQILTRSDLFVSHAGANSLHESLYHSVPMVLVPHADDAFLNSIAACEAGAAVSLDLTLLSPHTLRLAANEILRNDGYRNNAHRVGSLLRRAGGTESAVRAIMDFAYEGRHKLFPTEIELRPV
jgi:MGT family glycosyltransferase